MNSTLLSSLVSLESCPMVAFLPVLPCATFCGTEHKKHKFNRGASCCDFRDAVRVQVADEDNTTQSTADKRLNQRKSLASNEGTTRTSPIPRFLHKATAYAGETRRARLSVTEFLEAWGVAFGCLVGTGGEDTSVIFANQWQAVAPTPPPPPSSPPRVPDRVSVVVPSVSAPRTPLRFADDDGRVRAGFQPSEPSYRGSYSQLRHSISSTGLAGSQPFRVSLSQRSQVNYNLDAPSIMFLAVSSVKWDTRVSVRQEDVCQN
ncbi:hypothetical protein NEUTE2DRAFT_130780 [Neurospora tetrasperma FGSC 2509]|nr:hypothetical protein NEUTE2DRAFT_130780 [Neurospora tetrasperma FGSC 2509]